MELFMAAPLQITSHTSMAVESMVQLSRNASSLAIRRTNMVVVYTWLLATIPKSLLTRQHRMVAVPINAISIAVFLPATNVHFRVMVTVEVLVEVSWRTASSMAIVRRLETVVFGNTCTSTSGQPAEIDPRMASFNCYTNDPHFIRAEAGDFRLRYNSPCINAGNNAYVTNTVDFAGNARIDNSTVDIGAYEYSASDDTNFTVQVANGTGGAIYYEGDTVTVAAEDRSPRYAFTRWTGDVSVLANANSMTNTFTMPTRNLSFTAEYDDLQSYLVIDLSGGPNAASYPVSNLTDIPSGGWTDEYKTTKLVLRRIDPGTFTMGSPENEAGRQSSEAQHEVTLTHSYYIGVFELTQRQWELVMGNRPSAFSNTVCYATRPVERVSYNQIRGTNLGKYWPQMNAVEFHGQVACKDGAALRPPNRGAVGVCVPRRNDDGVELRQESLGAFRR